MGIEKYNAKKKKGPRGKTDAAMVNLIFRHAFS